MRLPLPWRRPRALFPLPLDRWLRGAIRDRCRTSYQQISFDGDQAHGQFLVSIAGKNVWITVSGHLGSRDGYATFEPTEFKVGDLNVPVSLVNGALQQRLAEQHDRMKLPENVGGIKVENGQLVLTQK
jgi:hypothetical protein